MFGLDWTGLDWTGFGMGMGMGMGWRFPLSVDVDSRRGILQRGMGMDTWPW